MNVYFKLEIQLGNAAMSEPNDVAEVLEKIATRLRNEGFGTGGHIHDGNGNTVGAWDTWGYGDDD